jgi:hypothetical protein
MGIWSSEAPVEDKGEDEGEGEEGEDVDEEGHSPTLASWNMATAPQREHELLDQNP